MVNKRTMNGAAAKCSRPIQSVLAELLLKCDIYNGWHLQQAVLCTMARPLQQSFVE